MDLIVAKNLALRLMTKHGLHGWRFEFDNARRRFGCCRYYDKTITLSKSITLMNSESVENTILHEIAHALTPGHHHGPVWRAKAIEIGCDGKRCYSTEISTPAAKYVAECPKCKHVHTRYKATNKRGSCGSCSGGRFNEAYLLVFRPNTVTEKRHVASVSVKSSVKKPLRVKMTDEMRRLRRNEQSRICKAKKRAIK